MTITNLKEHPEYVAETIRLIERAFGYDGSHHFNVDFAPLMNPANHRHCFIKLNEKGQVMGHVGVSVRSILGYPVAFLGGIAVADEHRGQGVFSDLMTEAMAEVRDEVSLLFLWSDQEKLYQRYGFYLAGAQYECHQENKKKSDFEKTTLAELSASDRAKIKDLYQKSFCVNFTSVERGEEDWENVEKIKSAQLYLRRKNGAITDYYFQGKGQDLQDIIYEYGSEEKIGSLCSEIAPFGRLWSPIGVSGEDQAQYQFLVAPGSTRLMRNFFLSYTEKKILIRELNPMKQECYFEFGDELLGLTIEEFMRGVLGPGPFEELGEMKPLFISGLDSI